MTDNFLPDGTQVTVAEPSNWNRPIANKIRGRVGYTQRPALWRGDRYLVTFPALGRKRAFTHQFDRRDLLVVERTEQ